MENEFDKTLNFEFIIQIYKLGIFPMAKDRHDKKVYFINPKKRALMPIREFHVPKSFKRFLKKKPFFVTINSNFREIINKCATENRSETWINKIIEDKFNELHELGIAHSIECWKNNEIVGGIYGISIGGCFFAESMFSKVSNASKFALINLVARLHYLNYSILDIQFINQHLRQFGAYEVSQNIFKKKLAMCIDKKINFQSLSVEDEDLFENVLNFLQDINETS
ncbi:MAG: leucyl/phenylalanyl-tRNA--protein transferase [SAR116 cluster bacterium]|nr:leucyl/phenylalanyl-tRNA--protein transferase [SAR116 cluster bacterium]RPH07452.1 MAG: leucyl/phenylalanyl-tRNA--protein transferase [Alphaproteobacteria bacterium TMED54]|tara:strand:+ start:1088 stop:1762 length:675 start_codon:yes stop_codon:yes gene_type:complete